MTGTGYWLALANSRDRYHQLSIDICKQLGSELIISWSINTETCHLLANRFNRQALVRFYNW